MDQTVKERLVGMGVLLILGVIFIPLILDGNNSDLTSNTNQNLDLPIPSEGVTHEMDFSDGNLRRLALPLPESTTSTVSNSEENTNSSEQINPEEIPASGFVDELPQLDVEKNVAKSSVEKVHNDSQAAVSEPTGKIIRDQTKNSTSEEPSKTDRSLQTATSLQSGAASSAASAWVVQIGSFGDRKNAEKEVASLKAKGFTAFLRRFVTAEDKVLYRVRVGPEKDRLRAEKLFERLSKAGIKGQIVPDP